MQLRLFFEKTASRCEAPATAVGLPQLVHLHRLQGVLSPLEMTAVVRC